MNSREIIKNAQLNNYAIPQFNINNLEWAKCILSVSEKKKNPIILGVTKNVIEYIGGCKTIVNFVNGLIFDLKITVPVVLHLDHGRTLNDCIQAVEAGFTSIMIGTDQCETMQEKIELVKSIVEYGKSNDVTIETELGSFDKENSVFCIEDCVEMIKKTNVDAFAPALGSKHGMTKCSVDFKQMEKLYNRISIPLVLHGGSGLSDDDIEKAISYGCCKININTENMVLWTNGVRKYLLDNPNEFNPRKIISAGITDMSNNINHRIDVIYNKK
jgi:fructose-bisphosphate aldolase class II